MIKPGEFDPHAFDLVDLWNQTIALGRELPDTYVSGINSPENVSMVSNQVRMTIRYQQEAIAVDFYAKAVRAKKSEVQKIADEITELMGNAAPNRVYTADADPRASSSPDRQIALARKLLSGLYMVELIQANEEADDPVKTTASQASAKEFIVVPLATINFHLAKLAGVDTKKFEEAMDYAPQWKPHHSIPSSLSWLAAPRRSSI